jgi:hypothetical protein
VVDWIPLDEEESDCCEWVRMRRSGKVGRWWEDREYGTVGKGGSEKKPESRVQSTTWPGSLVPIGRPEENPVLIGQLEEDPASHSLTHLLESCFSSYSLLYRTIEGPVFVFLIRLLVP